MPDAHPWMVFLEARRNFVRWMRSEGRTYSEILMATNMDIRQVQLLEMGTPGQEGRDG